MITYRISLLCCLKRFNQLIQHTLLIESGKDVTDVVGEEALVVQHGGGHLSDGGGTHGLVVVVSVRLQAHFSHL